MGLIITKYVNMRMLKEVTDNVNKTKYSPCTDENVMIAKIIANMIKTFVHKKRGKGDIKSKVISEIVL